MEIKYLVQKNKIVCLFVFRLKSQEGTFLLYKAVTGGCGIPPLAPVDCAAAGNNVPYLKEQARSSALYLILLNSDIDITTGGGGRIVWVGREIFKLPWVGKGISWVRGARGSIIK